MYRPSHRPRSAHLSNIVEEYTLRSFSKCIFRQLHRTAALSIPKYISQHPILENSHERSSLNGIHTDSPPYRATGISLSDINHKDKIFFNEWSASGT